VIRTGRDFWPSNGGLSHEAWDDFPNNRLATNTTNARKDGVVKQSLTNETGNEAVVAHMDAFRRPANHIP